MHVSKCTLECSKSDCGYKLSQGVEMNFKYFCVGQDKYFSHYNGSWRITPEVNESAVEGEIEGNKDIEEETNE